MDRLQALNKVASDKGVGGNFNAMLALAALVLVDKNSVVQFDADDLVNTLARLKAAGSANGVFDLEGAVDPAQAVQAFLSTNLAGANNDLVFTAVAIGADGNGITVQYVDPGANDAVLGIVIVGTAITINLATDEEGVITTIADDISALDFDDVVTVADKAANDGSGLVIAMAATPLAGGSNATGDGTAGKGSRYTNYAAGTLWINTGTAAAPVWEQLATV